MVPSAHREYLTICTVSAQHSGAIVVVTSACPKTRRQRGPEPGNQTADPQIKDNPLSLGHSRHKKRSIQAFFYLKLYIVLIVLMKLVQFFEYQRTLNIQMKSLLWAPGLCGMSRAFINPVNIVNHQLGPNWDQYGIMFM